MDAHDYLKQIKDKNSIAIVSGLTGITEYINSKKIRPDLANTLFHALIPLLNHNHYKIRSMSLALTELLFIKAFSWLSDTILALPLLLFSLSSVKEDIQKSARVSLEILCDSLNIDDWWGDVENALKLSRSTKKVRVILLKMLKNMANRIPLKPIVDLIDDPIKEISDLAVEVLLAADFEKAKAVLIDSRLTFGAHQKVYDTFIAHNRGNESESFEPQSEFLLDLGAKDSIAGQLDSLDGRGQRKSVARQVKKDGKGGMNKKRAPPRPLKPQQSVTEQLMRAESIREQKNTRGKTDHEERRSVKSQRSVSERLVEDEDRRSVRSQKSVSERLVEDEDRRSVRSQKSVSERLVEDEDRRSVRSQKSVSERLVEDEDRRSVRSQKSVSERLVEDEGAKSVRSQKSVSERLVEDEDRRSVQSRRSISGKTNWNGSVHMVKRQMSMQSPSLKMKLPNTSHSVSAQGSMVYTAHQLGSDELDGGTSGHGLDEDLHDEANFAKPHVSTSRHPQWSESIPGLRKQMSMQSPKLRMDGTEGVRGLKGQASMVYRANQFVPEPPQVPTQPPVTVDTIVDNQAPVPRRIENMNQPIPLRISVRKKEPKFTLRDMTHMTWLERCTYLEMLENAVESGKMLDISGSEIIQCALTASFPLHKKTTPLLAGFLSKLVRKYPEEMNENLQSIVHLLLHAIRPPSILKAGNGKVFLDAILSEAIPDQLIDAALNVASENNRPVMLEQFVLMVYDHKPETVLPRGVFRRLLSYLLNNRPRSEARDKLLFLLCRKDTADVIQFYHQQSKEVRVELRPFIPLEEYETERKRREYDPNGPISIEKMSQKWLKSTLEKEFRNGARGNFQLLADALKALEIDDFDSLLLIFKKFLVYLSTLPENFIQEHRMELDDLCARIFSSPKLFSILEAKRVRPSLVKGLSTFVWHCPMSSLSSSAVYYPKLYKLFQESDSPQRLAIIKMAIAIENVTGRSILALQDISKLHRNVITSLLSQFQVSEIAPQC